MKNGHTIDELENVYKYVDDLLTNIDDEALAELMGGTNNDVNKMLNLIIDETSSVILNQKTAPIKTASVDYLDRLTSHMEETFRINNFNYFVMSVLPTFDVNWHHVEWGNMIQLYKWLCIIAARDHCFGKGTRVRMYDGSIKVIEEIEVGDLVMGPDGQSRKVLSTHNGIDQLYSIQSDNYRDVIVTGNHNLVLWNHGDYEAIPTYIAYIRQKDDLAPQRTKDGQNIPIREITKMGQGHYYGFECNKDHLFLLEDGLIVHNSKSFTFSKAYPLWKLYRYKAKSPLSFVPKELTLSKQGILITNEYNLAKHHLAEIRDEIESNHILHEKLYPEGKKAGWGKEEIKCKNGASLIVKSYGSKMRGYHPGYMIVDDFLNESCLYSSDQRNKYINMFHSVIMNMIVPGGEVKVVGTPFHKKDLYADLKTKRKWAVFEYPAILPDGSLLWGDRHNYESILDKRDSQGSIIFSREILVRPVSSDSTIFPYKLVEQSFVGMDKYILCANRQSHPLKFKKVATGCDFARSANIGADYSVFITLGVDDLNNYWLLDIRKMKGASYGQQLSTIKQINRDWRPDVICMETNAMQTLFVDGAKEANLPILEHHTGKNKYDLKSGLPGMAILFEHNRFRFPRGNQRSIDLTDWLAMELAAITWTDKGLQGAGEHDDGPMSLWKGVVGCNYLNSSFDFAFI